MSLSARGHARVFEVKGARIELTIPTIFLSIRVNMY